MDYKRLVSYDVIEVSFKLRPGDFGLEEGKLANSSSSNCRRMLRFLYLVSL